MNPRGYKNFKANIKHSDFGQVSGWKCIVSECWEITKDCSPHEICVIHPYFLLMVQYRVEPDHKVKMTLCQQLTWSAPITWTLALIMEWHWQINTHTHTHTHTQFSCNLRGTWQSQNACALSRHCDPFKQSSWSRRTGLSSQGVVWALPKTIAVSWEKALNLHPSKCRVDWWEADGEPNGKLPGWCLNSGPRRPWVKDKNHYTTQPPHTHTHTMIVPWGLVTSMCVCINVCK